MSLYPKHVTATTSNKGSGLETFLRGIRYQKKERKKMDTIIYTLLVYSIIFFIYILILKCLYFFLVTIILHVIIIFCHYCRYSILLTKHISFFIQPPKFLSCIEKNIRVLNKNNIEKQKHGEILMISGLVHVHHTSLMTAENVHVSLT